MITCSHCGRACSDQRALTIHQSIAHGEASTHWKTRLNRQRRLTAGQPHISDVRRRTTPRDPLSIRPDGEIALLEAVIAVARADAQTDQDAAAWLADVRQGLTRKDGANGEA